VDKKDEKRQKAELSAPPYSASGLQKYLEARLYADAKMFALDGQDPIILQPQAGRAFGEDAPRLEKIRKKLVFNRVLE
jgi:hypothetical protein